MKHYYFNNSVDSNGRHEIHTEDCSYLPSTLNRTYIGYCSDSNDALQRAKASYPLKSFDGCYWCCRDIHRD